MKKTLLILFAATVALAGCASHQGLPTGTQSSCPEICKVTTDATQRLMPVFTHSRLPRQEKRSADATV